MGSQGKMDSSSASATTDSATTDQVSAELAPDLPMQIQRYFDTLNRGDFGQTAALFAEDGQMVPPFEQPIVGREAIAQYLSSEARDMSMTPIECESVASADPADKAGMSDTLQRFLVRGRVKTPLLGVNVAWQFHLNTANEITKVRVKLLATLQELIKFNR